ncbi:MAG: precorrin-3B synthase [Pseudomonas sp.]
MPVDNAGIIPRPRALSAFSRIRRIDPLNQRPPSTPLRPSACPGLLRIVPALDGGICRIKLAGGSITSLQAIAVADAAAGYASGVIEATNRGNLQIRGIGSEQNALIARLMDAGLGPNNAAGDDVRNLMLSPTAGVDPQRLLDTWPLAEQILDTLQSHPRFHELSPKFALSLDGGEALVMLEHPHDLWLSALVVDGETQLAFGLAGCPAMDAPLAAVALDQAHALVVAVLEAFLDLARPEHTRMRHLLAEVTVDAFLENVAARLSSALRRDQNITGWRRPPIAANGHLGIYPQDRAGWVAVGGAVPLGRLDASMLRRVAQLASEWGDASLRLTPWQSLLLPNVRAEHAAALLAGLQNAGLLCSAEQPLAQIIACTGSAGCGKGLADTKADAVQLAATFEQNGLSLALHLSGCSRSCAAAHVAPVTLLAVAAGRYDLYFRDTQQPGFGVLRARDLTIEAVGALLAADSRSNTHD